MGVKLVFKYTEILKIYIILEILPGNNIYLNIYNNLDWGGDENNYYFITNYFFKIIDGAIS